MNTLEIIIVIWIAFNFLRISYEWHVMERPKEFIVFPLLHFVAILAAVFSNPFTAVAISAVSSIGFYWWAKPKYFKEQEELKNN